MTDQEKDEIVERVSKNVYRIVSEFSWLVIEMSGGSEGTYHIPTYEELTEP